MDESGIGVGLLIDGAAAGATGAGVAAAACAGAGTGAGAGDAFGLAAGIALLVTSLGRSTGGRLSRGSDEFVPSGLECKALDTSEPRR